MARGDVVADNQSIASLGNLDFQPAVGVEVVIRIGSGTGNSSPKLRVKQFDGTNISYINMQVTLYNLQGMEDSPSAGSAYTIGRKVFINNTDRIRLTNDTASAASCAFAGVQSK